MLGYGYMYGSDFLDNTVVTDPNPSTSPCPVIITDGTPAGTQKLTDLLADQQVFNKVYGAVGAEDLLFIDGRVDDNGSLVHKAFVYDGNILKEFSLSDAGLRRAYRNGDYYYLVTDAYVYLYDKTANLAVERYSQVVYFGDPLL